MDQNPPETVTPTLEAEKPDLDNLNPWLERYITEPFKGYEDKTHPDGTHVTLEEAIENSKEQLRIIARGRQGVLEYTNQIRARNGKESISQAEYDQDMVENFMAIALDLQSR